MDLFWPAMSVLGFLVLAGFVIALGTASTTRYEREQHGAGEPRQEPNIAAEPATVSGLGAASEHPGAGGGAAAGGGASSTGAASSAPPPQAASDRPSANTA